MKVFIIKIALFSIVLLAIIKGFGYFDNVDIHTTPNNNIISTQIFKTKNNLNALFLGNSYCYAGINTAYLSKEGIVSYNMGIASCGPQMLELMIESLAQKSELKSTYIFVLISPIYFTKLADNFEEYPIHRYLENPLSNEQLCLRFNLYGSYPNLVTKSCKKGIYNLVPTKKENNAAYALLNANCGYVYNSNIVDSNSNSTIRTIYKPLSEAVLDSNVFEKLITQCVQLESKGYKVYFLELPSYKLTSFMNEPYLNDYRIQLKKLIPTGKLIRISLPTDQTLFRDNDHLNSKGAYFATRHLKRSIDSLNNLH